MSILPIFLNDPYNYYHPSRIFDQQFGLELRPEDFIRPRLVRDIYSRIRCPAGYIRPWKTEASRNETGSTISLTKDQFQANLDVQQFKPEEISVKVNGDNLIIIEGKHDETQDEHGYISRHFVRRYVLPEGHDINRIQSKLSSDGVLTITAPKLECKPDEHRRILITHTGEPSRPIEEKKAEKKEE